MRDSSYRTLIQRGADTSAKDRAGNTPGQCNKDKKLLTKTMLMNFMKNVTEPKKVTKKESKPIKTNMSKPKSPPRIEKSASVDDGIVGDVDEADLEDIDFLLAKLSSIEDKSKHTGSGYKFLVPLEILEKIKRRYKDNVNQIEFEFDLIFRKCIMSGGTLLDVFELCNNLDDNGNLPRLPLMAPDPTAYSVFSELLIPWIEDYHHYKIDKR